MEFFRYDFDYVQIQQAIVLKKFWNDVFCNHSFKQSPRFMRNYDFVRNLIENEVSKSAYACMYVWTELENHIHILFMSRYRNAPAFRNPTFGGT